MKTPALLFKSAFILILMTVSVSANVENQITVDEPTVCFDCHGNIEIDMADAHVHTALSDGKCSDCHNPHASQHATLLTETTGEMCLSCHDEIKTKVTGKVAHLPAAEGGCLDCHEAHSSNHANQLTGSMFSLCSTCHDQVIGWKKKAVVHSPVADGECGTCHDSHGGEINGLLSNDVPALCLDCHEPDAEFNAIHESSAIQHSDCRTCHDPHATNTKGLLRSNQHAPFASGNCTACHEQGGSTSSSSFAVKKTPEKLCKMCHRDVGKAENTTAVTYRHSEHRESYCLDCHNPHTSDVDNILVASQADLCVRCHFNTPEHTKKRADYMTHADQDCSICHSLHLADNETLLKSVDTDLCANCHTKAHAVTHPLGDDVIDPRDNLPMTCLDCHQMHGGDYDYYLPLDPKMALCIQCHKR